jgi:uncharacterized Fe-S cluster protein YjdI
MTQKEYTNGEITVVWKPDLCIHSTICWNGLGDVFRPKERPWIKIDAASSEQIAAQVAQCPSGALSSYRNAVTQGVPAEPAPSLETRIEALPNGPLIVYGTVRIKRADGQEDVRSQTTALCRCGSSGNKPYCDGSHITVEFRDEG